MTSAPSQNQSDYRVDVKQKEKTISGVLDIITSSQGLVGHSGAFSAVMKMNTLFPRFAGADENAPMLVMKSEEPGTKPMLGFITALEKSLISREQAFEYMVADTINHLVNDLAVTGALPTIAQDVAFVDKLEAGEGELLVKLMFDYCQKYGMYLCGGEISEQPDIFARRGHITPCVVAIGELLPQEHIEGPRDIKIGDKLVIIPSNGPHTNGYTLIRDILMEQKPELNDQKLSDGRSVLEAVLEPHQCYFDLIRAWIDNDLKPNGLAHITGGGVKDNLVRILPDANESKAGYTPLACDAEIDLSKLQVPEIFKVIRDSKDSAPRSDETMLSTFNMGVGMVAVVSPEIETAIVNSAKGLGYEAYTAGEIKPEGSRQVRFINDLNWD